MADNGTISGCQEKKDFCSSSPCRNGGKCREGFTTYVCDCPEGSAGKDCSESKSKGDIPLFIIYFCAKEIRYIAGVEGSRQFRGDGYLIFTPDSKAIVLPWTVNFVFRTRQSDTFLIKIEMGSDHFASVEVNSFILILIDRYLIFIFK